MYEHTFSARDAVAMHDLGERLGQRLVAGDLVLLAGPLGAGKTTLTQGIARGLNVAGAVTSPTFVLARHHSSLGDGPDLVHVDAYRLSSTAELDDLDLDVSVEQSVTVVEWADGKVEALAAEPIRIVIDRDSDPRRVHVTSFRQSFDL